MLVEQPKLSSTCSNTSLMFLNIPCMFEKKCLLSFLRIYFNYSFLILVILNIYSYTHTICTHTYTHTEACKCFIRLLHSFLSFCFVVSNTDLKSFIFFFCPFLLAFYEILLYVFCNYVHIKVHDTHITLVYCYFCQYEMFSFALHK